MAHGRLLGKSLQMCCVLSAVAAPSPANMIPGLSEVSKTSMLVS